MRYNDFIRKLSHLVHNSFDAADKIIVIKGILQKLKKNIENIII